MRDRSLLSMLGVASTLALAGYSVLGLGGPKVIVSVARQFNGGPPLHPALLSREGTERLGSSYCSA
jgi:hypothetical protein